MNYELAKQLKDGGYPLLYINHESNPIGEISFDFGNGLYALAPSLSELIAACGEKFLFLKRRKENEWVAHTSLRGNNPDVYWKDGVGSIPEESVANLWLNINKK